MRKHLILMTVAATLLTSCGGSKTTTADAEKFDYTVEQFADLQILRYKVPGFEELTLKQKELPDTGCFGRKGYSVRPEWKI